MQNGFVESFNGRVRDECLTEWLFASYRHARAVVAKWKIDDNVNRPHMSLDGFTPNEFASRSRSAHRWN
ncbi:MAG: transposase [Rhizobiales bacterium]|nr:transposase [Hyphomicrobiales bacterium]